MRLVRRRLEHALLPRPRLEGLRLRAAEFQPVEEAPAARELWRGGCGIACMLGFFRPQRAVNLLGGDAESVFGRRVEQRVVLSGGARFARSRRPPSRGRRPPPGGNRNRTPPDPPRPPAPAPP